MALTIRLVNPTSNKLEEHILEQKILSNRRSTIEEAILENKTDSHTFFSPTDIRFKELIQGLNDEKEYHIQYLWSGIDVVLRYDLGDLDEILLFGTELFPKPEYDEKEDDDEEGEGEEKEEEEPHPSERVFPSYVDDWRNYGEVKLYGTLSKKNQVEDHLLALLSQERYEDLSLIIHSIEIEEWEPHENYEFLTEQGLEDFLVLPAFPIENLEDFKENTDNEIDSILGSIAEVEEETNGSINGLKLIEIGEEKNKDLARMFFDRYSYQVYEGVLKEITWSPFGDSLEPTAIVEYNFSDIPVSLYSPKTLLLTEAEIDKPFYFANGDLLGAVPLTKERLPAITSLDLL